MVEQESLVSQKLKVKFTQVKEVKQDFIEVLPEINNDHHPILHSFITNRISQL